MTGRTASELTAGLVRGDGSAVEEVVRAYTPYLRAVVRRLRADRLRAKFDSADVVQSVWAQLVRRVGADGWRVGSEAQLRGLLATIARRRLLTRARQHPAADAPAAAEPAAAGPRPSEVAQAGDLWERMLRLCPPEHHPILVLRRQGLRLAEVAARTGLHEGSVRRILRTLSRDLALGGGDA